MCCPRTLTSSPHLTSHPVCLPAYVWLLRTTRRREGVQRSAGKEQEREFEYGGSSRQSQYKNRHWRRRRAWETETEREREARGLGKRLGTKTQGNWETKSEPGINRKETKARDERTEGGEGLWGCEARITQRFVTSSAGAQQMSATDLTFVVVIVLLTAFLWLL